MGDTDHVITREEVKGCACGGGQERLQQRRGPAQDASSARVEILCSGISRTFEAPVSSALASLLVSSSFPVAVALTCILILLLLKLTCKQNRMVSSSMPVPFAQNHEFSWSKCLIVNHISVYCCIFHCIVFQQINALCLIPLSSADVYLGAFYLCCFRHSWCISLSTRRTNFC